jgi:hypothetical protein
MKWGSFQQLVSRHRFVFAITAVISVALLMTAVSLSLYVTSGTSRLDLSRPGYEAVRKDVQITPEENFASDGPVDKAALDEFNRLLQKRRTNLNALGDFKDTSLDDATLRLQVDVN